jgi:hypothetical protein
MDTPSNLTIYFIVFLYYLKFALFASILNQAIDIIVLHILLFSPLEKLRLSCDYQGILEKIKFFISKK